MLDCITKNYLNIDNNINDLYTYIQLNNWPKLDPYVVFLYNAINIC